MAGTQTQDAQAEPQESRMIIERHSMNVRETVHQLIDSLPDESLAELRDCIADLQGEDATLHPETQAAIEEGLNDIRNGRTISLADYRQTRGL
jgi:hypothetical protein